jgi:hypothetical protein
MTMKSRIDAYGGSKDAWEELTRAVELAAAAGDAEAMTGHLAALLCILEASGNNP